ncbi:MAG TPA: molybdopterin molybdotransferase MoeA [Gammaproteobacteria bacterium]
MTETYEAERLILERMPSAAACRERLEHCVDRVLAEDVFAERDQPPFDRVTMDGIAIAYRDWSSGTRRFTAAGTQAAGAAQLTLPGPGRCIEVMTGAIMPAGCDTVIPVERVERRGEEIEVRLEAEVTERQFVHPQGSDRRKGARVLARGTRIGPPEMAVLASAGCAEVAVAALPRIAVISTGDELVDVGEPLAPHQIRSSNDRAIEAALLRERLAVVSRTRLPDDERALLDAIQRLHAEHDALILSGGVSMGQFDYVPAVLDRLGATLVFHKIEQRPGRPMWFGVSGDGKPVFALPGNPVSTLVCVTRYVLPALRASLGLEPFVVEYAVLTAPVTMPARLTYFMPVVVESTSDGVLHATPRPTNTSGDFITLAGTAGFVELPHGPPAYPEGASARLYRW